MSSRKRLNFKEKGQILEEYSKQNFEFGIGKTCLKLYIQDPFYINCFPSPIFEICGILIKDFFYDEKWNMQPSGKPRNSGKNR